MYPEIIRCGVLTIYSYGFMISCGVLLTLILLRVSVRHRAVTFEQVSDAMFCALLTGFAGARTLFVAFNWHEVFAHDFGSIVKVWEGGLIFYGGLFGALLGLIVFSLWRKISFWGITDALVPYVALTQAFGRVGCFLNGCCWGKETALPIGVQFPSMSMKVHPTQLYEAAYMVVIFFVLMGMSSRSKKSGQMTIAYFLFYGLGRFVIEFFRGDQVMIYWGLTVAQLISLGIVISAGIGNVMLSRNNHG